MQDLCSALIEANLPRTFWLNRTSSRNERCGPPAWLFDHTAANSADGFTECSRLLGVPKKLTENELSDFSSLWQDGCVKQSSRHNMWTEITRPKYERGGQRYASDLTDGEWALIEPHMPAAKPWAGRGRSSAGGAGRHLIHRTHRLSVADAAKGLSAVYNHARLFLRLARQRLV